MTKLPDSPFSDEYGDLPPNYEKKHDKGAAQAEKGGDIDPEDVNAIKALVDEIAAKMTQGESDKGDGDGEADANGKGGEKTEGDGENAESEGNESDGGENSTSDSNSNSVIEIYLGLGDWVVNGKPDKSMPKINLIARIEPNEIGLHRTATTEETTPQISTSPVPLAYAVESNGPKWQQQVEALINYLDREKIPGAKAIATRAVPLPPITIKTITLTNDGDENDQQ